MLRCLVDAAVFEAAHGTLHGEAAHHLRNVLRVRAGDTLTLLDGAGRRRAARIVALERHAVSWEAGGSVEIRPPPATATVLYQCVIKAARMDWLVEKAVELGAAELVPVRAARCVARPAEGADVARWRRLADGALEQCGGLWRLRIAPVCGWADALARIRAQPPVCVAALTPEARPFRTALPACRAPDGAPPQSIGWCVGPEGDFTPHELTQLQAAGALPVSLGDRVLRAETAALCGLVALAGLLDDGRA